MPSVTSIQVCKKTVLNCNVSGNHPHRCPPKTTSRDNRPRKEELSSQYCSLLRFSSRSYISTSFLPSLIFCLLFLLFLSLPHLKSSSITWRCPSVRGTIVCQRIAVLPPHYIHHTPIANSHHPNNCHHLCQRLCHQSHHCHCHGHP